MNQGANIPEMDEPMEVAALWCMRLSDDDMSEAEWSAFEDWQIVPENAALLAHATMVWQASGDVGDRPEIIPLRAEALSEYYAFNQARWSGGAKRNWYIWGALAACLALVFAITLVSFRGQTQVIETGIGERRVTALSDTSKVSLDALTEVDVVMDDGAREIELKHGRAKFDVARDPLRPFRVNAGDKMIVAIGTSFSVELVGKEVRIILYEGQVEVRDRDDLTAKPEVISKNRQTMTPGTQLVDTVGSNEPGKLTAFEPAQSLSWEHGLLSFSGDTLTSAVEQMNRYSERKIRIGDSAIVRIPVDGEFEAGNIDAFAEGMATLYGLRVTANETEIILTRR